LICDENGIAIKIIALAIQDKLVAQAQKCALTFTNYVTEEMIVGKTRMKKCAREIRPHVR